MNVTEHPAVRCESVSRRYDGGTSRLGGDNGRTVRALEDVSLHVQRGEVVGITGPSGSGKSTLLHVLGGLDEPTGGRVEVRGTDVASLSGSARSRFRLENVGIVFQRFHLLPALTAAENVALPLLEQGVGRATRRDRSRTLLESVGLGDRTEHRPGQLSGGEQQRVAIARALAADPALVIADEPTGELDTDTGNEVLDQLVSASSDRAVVIASHDDRALERADRIVRLRDGTRYE